MQDIYTVLGVSEAGVKSVLANIHNHYTPRVQPKIKFGKIQLDKDEKVRKRYLQVPSPHLKNIQKKINSILQQLPLPENMYGAIVNRNNIKNAKQHLNKKYFFTVDLKDFFININHVQVFQMLVKRGFPTSSARLITKLSTYKKSLPQGASCSPVIANLVFSDTIEKINYFINGRGIVFSNFLDDLCFSSNSDFKKLGNEILDIIREDKFYPSHNKIHYRVNTCEITGLVVQKSFLNVISKMREEAKRNPHIKAYVKRIDNENKLISFSLNSRV